MKADVVFSPNQIAQEQYLEDIKTFFLYMSGGYGSGKTLSLVMKAFTLMDLNPGIPAGILCPTTKMFKRDVLPTFKEECDKFDIPFLYRRADGELYFPYTKTTIYIYHGEDHGQSIAGANLGWGLINEASLCSWETIKAFFARMRLRRTPFPQVAMNGTPEEFNWVYQKFIETPMVNSKILYADSRKNTNAAPWYIGMLEDSYDEVARQQYVEGRYVPRTGSRFLHTFDRHKHLDETIVRIDDAEQYVSVDFNVNPMGATIFNHTPGEKKWLTGWDQVKLEGANTYTLCEELAEKLGYRWREAVIYPDPHGNRRQTTDKDLLTDIEIMEDFGFKEIRYNPKQRVKDCYFAANNLVEKGRIAIHPKCKDFIADAEQVKILDGHFQMDKSHHSRTHWIDGFKNMCDYEWPAIKSYSTETTRKIR